MQNSIQIMTANFAEPKENDRILEIIGNKEDLENRQTVLDVKLFNYFNKKYNFIKLSQYFFVLKPLFFKNQAHLTIYYLNISY